MNLPRHKIELLGKPYFDANFIKRFIEIIDRLAPDPDRYFFQVTQRNDKPTMELGCKAGRMLIDVTSSAESTTTIVDQLSSVISVVLTEVQNSTQLDIYMPSPLSLTYITSGEDGRKALKEYAEYLQMNLFGRRNALE